MTNQASTTSARKRKLAAALKQNMARRKLAAALGNDESDHRACRNQATPETTASVPDGAPATSQSATQLSAPRRGAETAAS